MEIPRRKKQSMASGYLAETWIATCKNTLEHSLTPYLKINSKWIKHLNKKLGPYKTL